MKKSTTVMSVVIFLLFVLAGGGIFYFYRQPVGYVGIDINPSIQFAVNRLDRVVEVIPLNDEADILVSDLDLINMDVDDAVEAIIDSSVETGYIDEFSEENMVVVSAALDDEDEIEKLENDLYDTVTKRLEDKEVPAIVLKEQDNAERRELADEYGVTYGALLIAQKAVALNPDLSLDEIINDPINENARRMQDARREEKEEEKGNQEGELVQAKTRLREETQARTEEKIQTLLRQAEQAREDITEDNMNQFKNEVVKEEKEDIIGRVKNIKGDVEQAWGAIPPDAPDNNTGDDQNNNGDTGNDDIPTNVREKMDDIKERWNTGKGR